MNHLEFFSPLRFLTIAVILIAITVFNPEASKAQSADNAAGTAQISSPTPQSQKRGLHQDSRNWGGSPLKIVNIPPGNSLEVRDGPSMTAPITHMLSQDTRDIKLWGEPEDGWATITFGGTNLGWARAEFLENDFGGLGSDDPEAQKSTRPAAPKGRSGHAKGSR